MRAVIVGSGSEIPSKAVTNQMLSRIMDTSDEWIRERSGVETRYYVEPGTATSDLGVAAARRALESAGVEPAGVDLVVFATMTPDHYFPGSGPLLQAKLGLRNVPCYDIRQQCSGFVYGLQMADAFIRSGMYKRILLIGAELHSHALDFTTRGRDVMVLFGDGAGALVLGPMETDDPRAGVMYTSVRADGNGVNDLNLKIFEIARMPYLDYDPKDREQNAIMYPKMDGKRVYLNAVRGMVMSTNEALAKTGMTWDDIQWFVPHQANLRINEKVAEVAKIPHDKVLNTIEFYGNTTAATVPLTIDYWRQQGKVKRGDRILSSVFGSGFTWGAAIFTL